MKALICFFIICIVCMAELSGQVIFSNGTITTSSLHGIPEPRSISLGESVVASAQSPTAWNINPATLAGLQETGIDYSYSDYYLSSLDHGYYSAGGWIGTAIGTFALHYSLYNQGKWQFTFESGASAGIMSLSDYTIAASYATSILAPLSLGASIKFFTAAFDFDSSATERDNSISNVYLDLGLLYSTAGIIRPDVAPDSLHIGIALQDIGGDIAPSDFSSQTLMMLAGRQKIGRLLRAGMEYDITLLYHRDIPLLRGRLTVGSQVLLNGENNNPGSTSSGIDANASAGLEAIIYDIAALRLGTVIYSDDNVYGNAGVATFRIGAGLNLPLKRVGLSLPLTVGVDYNYTRTQLQPPFFFDSGDNRVEAFGVHVKYTLAAIE
jgi:hypothetical protein